MRTLQRVALLLCAAVLAGPAAAQTTAPAATPVEPSVMLKQLPAGAMGYLVVKNIQAGSQNVEKFLADIGVSAMVRQAMPDGLSEMLRKELKLGEGFNPNGGFAVVMLDPAQFGVDLVALAKASESGDKPKDVKLPFVIFVPAKDIDSLFPNHKREPAGDFTKIQTSKGELMGKQSGSYVLLSPMDAAIKAVLAPKATADSELNATQRDMLNRSDIAVQLNMKVCAPTFNKLMDMADAKVKAMTQPAAGADGEMASMPHPMGPMAMMGDMPAMIKMYRDLMGQIDGLTIGGRFAKTGVVLEALVAWNADSVIGKQMAAAKPAARSPLGKLPNFSYVLAGGNTMDSSNIGAQYAKSSIDMLTKLLVNASGGKITAEQGDKIGKLLADLQAQCTGGQFVAGGAPDAAGLIGIAAVMECKDADKAKALLAEAATTVQDLIKSLGGADAQALSISYTKDGGGDGIDSIDITHPEMASMPEEAQRVMTSFIGEAKIRILISAPDKNTVVMTFGGTKAMMDETLKAVKGGGTLPKDAGLTEAMEYMPKNLVGLVAFNAGNLFDLITKGMQFVPGAGMMLPFRITTQVPVTIGTGVDGTMEHMVIFVPTQLVREAAGIFMMFGAMGGGGMGGDGATVQPIAPPQGGF